jgi:nodulation protein E
MHRVVVSGIGVISALGLDSERFRTALQNGQGGIAPITLVDTSQIRIKNAAEVKGYNPDQYFPPKQLGFMDRFAQFAVIAAREAVASAGVEWTPDLLENTAIVTGACIGGRTLEESGYWEMFHNDRSRVHPLTIPLSMVNAGASHISIEFGVHGPTFTTATACASSAHAIGQAFWMVRSGVVPMAIAGGSEAPLFFGGLKAWEAMRVVSSDTCRPFSLNRSGMILGEGAAMLILEPLESALARGARPLALSGPCELHSAMLDCDPNRSGISTRTAPQPKPTIPPRLRQFAAYLASTLNGWQSVPPSRCMATRWARRVRLKLS